MKNFMGADTVFVTSQIPEGVVIATPINNIAAYYVDPGDSEFAKAGLQYTTDSATGFIGFHVQGTYERAISDMFAIMDCACSANIWMRSHISLLVELTPRHWET